MGNKTKLFGKPVKTYTENCVKKYKINIKQFLGYQALNESLKWLRDNQLRYGNNPSYDLDLMKSNEIGNPQPSL